jgi:hypothetical protein
MGVVRKRVFLAALVVTTWCNAIGLAWAETEFRLLAPINGLKCNKIPQCFNSGEEEICAALDRREGRHTRYPLADRAFRHGEIEGAVLVADERVSLVAQFVEIPIVNPDVLCELKLPHEARTQNE